MFYSNVRVNNRIRVPQVRCISATGEQIGILPTSEALKIALASGLDLVEISPNANPPVCRIINFGKFRYEESRREKLARKHQASTTMKEMKFHANVEDHDYRTKMTHIREFLEKGHRVKASLLFRGRENEHRDLGYAIMNRLIKDCTDVGVPEAAPRMFGNNLIMLLRPQRGPKAEGTQPAAKNPPPPGAPARPAPGTTAN